MNANSIEEVKKAIMTEVKNEKIEDVEINKRGNVVFKTKCFKYECRLKQKNGMLTCTLAQYSHPLIIIGAIVGLLLLLPLIIVLILSILDISVKKDIKRQVDNILINMQ